MFAPVFAVHALLILPMGLMASPTRDCQLDQMTMTRIDEQSLAAFHTAAEEYAALHRRLERALMIDHVPWPEDEDMGSETLADVIRAARPQTQPGVIFNPGVTPLFRMRIEKAVWVNRYEMGDALPDLATGGGAVTVPAINAWWMWEQESAPWASLIWELPALPDELEYRFRGRHLVLVDTHANLVVDVLENALPEQ